MRVSKWGNSLGIRLPAAVVEALDLKDGDDVVLYPKGDRAFAVERRARDEEVLQRLRALGDRLPADFRFEREEANAR
ncbi:AbrB/MazE/SpoVT family DNA-binding domain-containing protein [Luteibacter pinisoli]|uniref:AbrB/MazE/SpoVT family DNA-binding domain-containing protein n=1 Tax=Luteibacter pinisoli TaxID=2589080 RepID=A0A4Y5YZK3_9GAMM|nr:AbrB/MazE/SpoVT family DNA-binding domain-containing protein [Luteibacter pinisoli]QDE38254.1 AbrB/MazE/SpoVT family DNA-binding domain-containing protein [Luteibacter pinisoli]